jgi:hypothetical protein
MYKPKFIAFAPALLCLTACVSSGSKPTVAPRVVDARADEQLKRMTSCVGALGNFGFEAEVRYDEYLVDSQKVQLGKRVAVDVRRPTRARAVVDGDIEHMRYWYDGNRVVILDVHSNQYAEAPALATIDATLTAMAENYGLVLPLAELIAADSYTWLMNNVESAVYVGQHVIDGTLCHHLAYEQPTLDWQIWIEAGEPALPRRLVISYKQLPNCPQYEVSFRRWTREAALNETEFAVQLPENATRIDFRPPDRIVGTGTTPQK